MTGKSICTKDHLVEIRKLTNSFLNHRFLVKDVFGMICEFACHREPFECTVFFDIAPRYRRIVTLPTPNVRYYTPVVRNRDQLSMIEYLRATEVIFSTPDFPISTYGIPPYIIPKYYDYDDRTVCIKNIHQDLLKIKVKYHKNYQHTNQSTITIQDTVKKPVKKEIVKLPKEIPKKYRSTNKYSHLKPNYDFKNINYNKCKKRF